jgi:hypothetical protein
MDKVGTGAAAEDRAAMAELEETPVTAAMVAQAGQ